MQATIIITQQAINAAASMIRKEGRIGSMVLINHLWDAMNRPWTLDVFKSHLLAAMRAGAVELSRCDMRGHLSLDDVRESEIKLSHSDFHFVRVS